MSDNPYLDALKRIPRGQTRSYLELAALAGRPGAARAAGRAISALPDDSAYPWHRVVSASGSPKGDKARELLQWRRLRREGARPKKLESVAAWARRTGVAWVGNYRTREYASATDERLAGWSGDRVERFESETEALARGFRRAGKGPRRIEPLPDARFVSVAPEPPSGSIEERLRALDWTRARGELKSTGFVRIPALLTSIQCATILLESTVKERFERSVDMFPRGFGVGSYHYYKEPLPDPAGLLRETLYRELSPLANELWPGRDYPSALDGFWARCRRANQIRPSSILICYGEGGVNHPHRDVYGPVWFPFQALLMLARRGRDFDGGDFLLADEAAPWRTSEVELTEGDVVVFASRERLDEPSNRAKKLRRIPVRHGMRTVTRGKRYGLGIVFHLAE